MGEEKQASLQECTRKRVTAGEHKQPYRSPRLVDLGSIETMTFGPMGGFEDVLMAGVGGTQGV